LLVDIKLNSVKRIIARRIGAAKETSHLENENTNSQTNLETIDYAPAEIQKKTRILDNPDRIRAQKEYLQKLDSINLPTISALCFFEYLDQGNVAVSSNSFSKR
jgi:hypothetical protein